MHMTFLHVFNIYTQYSISDLFSPIGQVILGTLGGRTVVIIVLHFSDHSPSPVGPCGGTERFGVRSVLSLHLMEMESGSEIIDGIGYQGE